MDFLAIVGRRLARRASQRRQQPAPLSPQRLERRRVLDAGAAELLLGPSAEAGDWVQVGENLAAQSDTAATGVPAQPSLVLVPNRATIFEDQTAELTLRFVGVGRLETYTVQVDWGDGSAIEQFEEVRSDSPLSLFHQYFDDDPTVTLSDVFEVKVTVTDDAGRQSVVTTPVFVLNVQPVLTVAGDAVVDEGALLDLTEGGLGSFTDVGTLDTHTATVNWGDGTPTETVTVNQLSGGGTLDGSHRYADNGQYTVTVVLRDDDQGLAISQFQVEVRNVAPTLEPIIAATDVNSRGETTLTIEFADPGADELVVLVDWGDQLALPPDQRFVAETFVLGPGTQTLTLLHTYAGPPNPASPASDILLSVFIRDDDFGDRVVALGQSETRRVAISNPGIGVTPVVIDTTPLVPRLVFPQQEEHAFFLGATLSDEGEVQTADLRTAVGDTKSATDRFLELRVIDPASAEPSEGYRLKPEVLHDLPGLFRTLPDNRYAIYLVRTETNSRRLVIEVDVRNGKLIDPGDDSEGTRDRPPTEEATERAREGNDSATDKAANSGKINDGAKHDSQAEEVPALDFAPPEADAVGLQRTRMLLGTALVGLAASKSGRSWAERIDQVVATADSRKWHRLRYGKPNNRR